jgi:hypothetical protein
MAFLGKARLNRTACLEEADDIIMLLTPYPFDFFTLE